MTMMYSRLVNWFKGAVTGIALMYVVLATELGKEYKDEMHSTF